MKNIYILPTNRPSRLIHNDANQLCYYSRKSFKNDRKIRKKFNIYITNNEEIKEGYYLDWIHNTVMKSTFYSSSEKNCKKIILTTDYELIKDGIQAINNEFLKWFINNPSYDRVEVKSLLSNNNRALFGYKITTPKNLK